MGCGILTTYTEIANIAGIHGLLAYCFCGAVPIVMFSVLGPKIRKRCPDGFVLTEWVHTRYGKGAALYFSLLTSVNMVLFMIGELSATRFIVEALTDIDPTPLLLFQCVVTTVYTSIGGIEVSLVTDNFQGFFVFIVLVVSGLQITSLPIDPELERQTAPQLLGTSSLGWQLCYILLVAIVSNDCFVSGFWLRTFASRTDHDLFVGTAIGSGVVFTVCFLIGLPGILAVWSGDLKINDPHGSSAFFVILSHMHSGISSTVLVSAIALSTYAFDSLQTGLTSTICNDVFRNKVPVKWTRAIVVLTTLPCVLLKSESVLQIYLMADLVSAAVVPVLILGLWEEKFWYWTAWEVICGGVGGFVCVFIFGSVYYRSLWEGAGLLLLQNGLYNSSDLGPLGAFIAAPFGGIAVGYLVHFFRKWRQRDSKPVDL